MCANESLCVCVCVCVHAFSGVCVCLCLSVRACVQRACRAVMRRFDELDEDHSGKLDAEDLAAIAAAEEAASAAAADMAV